MKAGSWIFWVMAPVTLLAIAGAMFLAIRGVRGVLQARRSKDWLE